MSTSERTVWMIAGFPCGGGDLLTLQFEASSPGWRHGVWLGVEGELRANDVQAPQLTLWADTAPPRVEIEVVSTEDGLLRLYNVWDSERGLHRESQAATSAMVHEEVEGGIRFRCNDIGLNPTFDSLVFTLRR